MVMAMRWLAFSATASSDGGTCTSVVPYSRDFLARAVHEIERLPPGSGVEQMLADFQVLGTGAGLSRSTISGAAGRPGCHLVRSIQLVPAAPVAIGFDIPVETMRDRAIAGLVDEPRLKFGSDAMPVAVHL